MSFMYVIFADYKTICELCIQIEPRVKGAHYEQRRENFGDSGTNQWAA